MKLFNIFNKKSTSIVEDKANKPNKRHIFSAIIGFIKRFWIIIVAIIIVVLACVLYKFISDYLYNKKYKPYEEKMHTYGFDLVYNNSKATSSEKVTKSEAIKMILSSIYNMYDISGFAYETQDTYTNAMWVKFAEEMGITDTGAINSGNENSNITYIDVIHYYINARSKILNKPLQSNNKASFSDLGTYSTDMQSYINDAVENKLIDNSKGKLNANKNITKGQLNKLVVNFVETYNTITLTGDKINVDPAKTPSNASDYPYVLFNVDKSVYEKPFTYEESSRSAGPINTYIVKKEYYQQMKEWSEYYYNKILNIDYSTISVDTFKNDLKSYVMYGVYDEDVKAYVDYVKLHKIKLTGTAKAQLPIIYYDGVDYRIRMKLDFNIVESDTKNNVLYQDLKNTTPYTYSDQNSILIDAKMGNVYAQNSVYVDSSPISIMITKQQ